MHRHLVTVEVGVEPLASQRMQHYRVAFHQHRLERLNTHPVQSRRSVKQHRVLVNHLFQDIPYLLASPFNHLLGAFDGVGQPALLEPADNERLIQLQRNPLRQPALMQSHRRPYHNHGPGRIIYSLAKQVLSESTLLAFYHITQALQRPVITSQHRPAASAVVHQRIHRLLKHSLLVANNHFRRIQVHQLFQPVVTIDYAPVKIVQITGRKITTLQKHQRTQIRRDNRNHLKHHPLRLVAAVLYRVNRLESLA